MATPSVDDVGFFSLAAEEVDVLYACVVVELFYHLLHQVCWIYFSFVCCEWCYADVDAVVAGLCSVSVEGNGVSEFCEHVGIVLELCGELVELFVVLSDQLSSLLSVFVNVCDGVSVDVESQSEIFCSEYVVQVGDCCEVLGMQSAEQLVETFYTFVLPLEVGLHEMHVGGHTSIECSGEWSAENGDFELWVLCCELSDYWHCHSYVAEG